VIAATIFLSSLSLPSSHVEEYGKYLHQVEDLFFEADGCRVPGESDFVSSLHII
jgi:hypothetical protein